MEQLEAIAAVMATAPTLVLTQLACIIFFTRSPIPKPQKDLDVLKLIY
jgi:hypothetical protein